MKLENITEQEILFITENIHKGEKYCATQLGCAEYFIIRVSQKFGIKRKLRDEKRLRHLDINRFLNITEPCIAYYLGILWADGYLSFPPNSRYIGISLKTTDFNDIRDMFKSVGNFSFYERQPRKRCPNASSEARVIHRLLWDFLIEHDYKIKSQASADKILSKIPENLKHYWWRGYFDGDGCISSNETKAYSFGLAGSYSQDWTFAINLLESLNVKFTISRRTYKLYHSSCVKCQNFNGFLNFFKYIYKDYDDLGLKRKYDRYKEALIRHERHKSYQESLCQPISCWRDNECIGVFNSITQLCQKLNVPRHQVKIFFNTGNKYNHGYEFRQEKRKSYIKFNNTQENNT